MYSQDSSALTNNASAENEIHRVVQAMPLFGKCKTKECSDAKLIAYLSKHLKYPKQARKKGTEGRVYIQFIIEKNGSISNTKIVRDIPNGCGIAALKVVKKMKNKWSPGLQNDKPVRVLYTLPITFSLEKAKSKK